MGMMGEVGELAGAIENWIQYNRGLDLVNIKEELGDLMWYIALMCNASGISLEEVMEKNIAKLRLRYPDKYSDHNAAEENRDRAAERNALDD
jgi:NTP pyrophosphatase (non-canonical NTP hydrolase)